MISGRKFLAAAPAAVAVSASVKEDAQTEPKSPSPWATLDPANQREFPSKNPEAREIWLYTDKISYAPGDDVVFYVHTTAANYSIVIERDGASVDKVHAADSLKGNRQETPEDAYTVGCGWKESFRLKIPQDWKSGVYVVTASARFRELGIAVAEHFFVVRAARPGKKARMAYLLPTGTYVAYNDWGGANYYRSYDSEQGATELSLQRPWAKGFIRHPISAPKHGQEPTLKPFEDPRFRTIEWAVTHGFSRHYSDAGWSYFDSHFVKWAEGEGYAFDYLTQHDIHADASLLDNYQVLVIVGHDEYWTWQMRDAVDAFTSKGGNVARFAGNLIWQTRMENGGRTQLCYKSPESDPLHKTNQRKYTSTMWEHPVVNRPVSASLGLNGVSGAYIKIGGATPRSSGGLTVYRPEHWAFEGTDLYYGDIFGQHPTSIATFECDGLDYTFKNGLPEPTHLDGAPKDTQILALIPAVKGEEDHTDGKRNILGPLTEFLHIDKSIDSYFKFFANDKFPYAHGEGIRSVYGCCAIVTCTVGKGTVFNAGATCWIHGLQAHDFFTEQITRNVLNRLSGRKNG